MKIKKSTFKDTESGRIILLGILILILIPVVLYGIYRLVPIAWHGFFASLHGLRTWWHVHMADPTVFAMLYVVAATDREAVPALAIIALVHWTDVRINRLLSSFGFRRVAKQQGSIQENLLTL